MPVRDDEQEYKKIMSILSNNMNMNFVKRILTPDLYPRINYDDENYATHKMMWNQMGNKYAVMPSIIYQNNSLRELDPRSAYDYAKSSGEYIEFDTPEEADWFSKNYKKVWNR